MLPYSLLAVAGAILLFGAAELAHTTVSGDTLSSSAPPSNALSKNAPASNAPTSNSLSMSALVPNAVAQKTRNTESQNPLARTASATADLNGGVVEAISPPQPTQR